MKQHLLILFIFILGVIGSASAQVNKGNYYIGGSLYFNYDGGSGTTTNYTYANGVTQYNVSKLTTFQFSPEFGYFLSKKWAIGIQPNYSRSSGTETNAFTSFTDATHNYISSDTYHTDIVGLTVNFRYYCMLTEKIGVFPQFGISTENDIKDFKNGEITLGGSPNIVFFATPKLGINLGFGNIKYATDYHFKSNLINAGFNNAISFGLNYYWGKK
ncbi:MAG: hypothetical protein JWP37_3821 [Mucilaginibacter sp.]|nr:hypothetical protein [Mucilaginibacter sp.]